MKINSESIMIIVVWICALIGSAFVNNSLPFAFAFMFTIAVLNAKNKE